jgi:hypothetical protein
MASAPPVREQRWHPLREAPAAELKALPAVHDGAG